MEDSVQPFRFVKEEDMRYERQIIFGGIIIAIGLIWLIGNLLGIDLWSLICPLAIILAGVLLLFRPRIERMGGPATIRLLEKIDRRGAWPVRDEEIWKFVGDIHLDMTQADIPAGETRIRITGFVCNVDVLVPENVGVALDSAAFITSSRIMGRKKDYFLGSLQQRSEIYSTAGQKIHLETLFFVTDLRVDQVEMK
jgi:Cell wall-active antibiotics response LiaF, C-terminal